MRLVTVLLVITTLLPAALAHEDSGHGHHHEPHHWESVEMRREILTQLGGMAILGIMATGYLLIRRRTTT